MVRGMTFSELQKLVYKAYKKNKFEQWFNKAGQMGDIAEIGFVTTEVGEAIEHICHLNEEELRMELADIVIRVLNFCNRKDISLEEYIIKKNAINMKRGRLHGRVEP